MFAEFRMSLHRTNLARVAASKCCLGAADHHVSAMLSRCSDAFRKILRLGPQRCSRQLALKHQPQIGRLAEAPVNSQHVYFWNQLWLIVVTLTATGYGDLYPITHLGRLICCIAMVVGAFLLAVLTATVRQICTTTCPRFRCKIFELIDCLSIFHLLSTRLA